MFFLKSPFAVRLGSCTHQEGAPPLRPRGDLCGDGSPYTHQCRRSALHPGDFLAKRKSPKIRQEPPGSRLRRSLDLRRRGQKLKRNAFTSAPFAPPALCPSGIVRDNLNPQASSGAPPAAPRIGSRGYDSAETKGEKRPVCPLSSKWQIGLFLWQKVARRESEQSGASAKRAVTTHRGIPKGTALGDSLVTFSSGRKSPGCRAERLHTGECRGAKPLASRSKLLGGGGAQRPPHWGAQRGSPRIKTKTILDSSAGLRYTEKKENRRNHHVRKKTGPQRSLLVRQPEKI